MNKIIEVANEMIGWFAIVLFIVWVMVALFN